MRPTASRAARACSPRSWLAAVAALQLEKPHAASRRTMNAKLCRISCSASDRAAATDAQEPHAADSCWFSMRTTARRSAAFCAVSCASACVAARQHRSPAASSRDIAHATDRRTTSSASARAAAIDDQDSSARATCIDSSRDATRRISDMSAARRRHCASAATLWPADSSTTDRRTSSSASTRAATIDAQEPHAAAV